MTVGSGDLLKGDWQVFVLVGGEMCRQIDGAIIGFLGVILVDNLGCLAVTYKVEETLRFHTEFKAAFHLDDFDCRFLVVTAFVVGDIHLDTVSVFVRIGELCA